MKKSINIFFILFAALALGTNYTAYSQSARINKNRIGVIVGGGVAVYKGDLISRVQDFTPQGNFLLGLSYRCNGNFSLRSELNLFQLNSHKSIKNSDASFKSNNAELAVSVVYDIFRLSKSYIHRAEYTPYLFLGVGVTGFSSQSNQQTANTENMVQSTMGCTPVIPIGFGIRVKAAKYLDVNIEAGYRKTFTDKMDNVWPGAGEKNLSFQELTSQGGDGTPRVSNTDNYFFTQVKLVYSPTKFFKKKKQKIKGFSTEQLKKIKSTSIEIAKSKKLKVSR